MIGRRRFLTILAGGVMAGPGLAAAEWRGRALGADARIVIRGGDAPAALLERVRQAIDRIEAVFSLYRPSDLTRLNAGHAVPAQGDLAEALRLAARVHRATGGLFDPAVQARWRHLAGGPVAPPLIAMGGLSQRHGDLRLATGQALTLNGLAQGLATDRVAAMLAGQGLGPVLVDLGEARALDGDFGLELADPRAGSLGRLTLRAGRAVATSSPGAMVFASGDSHILGPQGQRPIWSTVSVDAPSAALADAASTAFVLMDRPAMARAAARLGVGPVRLIDRAGDLTTL